MGRWNDEESRRKREEIKGVAHGGVLLLDSEGKLFSNEKWWSGYAAILNGRCPKMAFQSPVTSYSRLLIPNPELLHWVEGSIGQAVSCIVTPTPKPIFLTVSDFQRRMPPSRFIRLFPLTEFLTPCYYFCIIMYFGKARSFKWKKL